MISKYAAMYVLYSDAIEHVPMLMSGRSTAVRRCRVGVSLMRPVLE